MSLNLSLVISGKARSQAAAEPCIIVPAWLFTFLRLLRGEAAGDYDRAWRALSAEMSAGYPLPRVDDAARLFLQFGGKTLGEPSNRNIRR